MAVGLDDYVDEVGIVERAGAAGVRLVGELPGGRPQVPDQAAQLEAVRRQAGATAFGVEVVLVPEAVLLRGWRGLGRGGDVLDVVTVDGDQPFDALRPERGDDAGGAAAPVVAGEGGRWDVQGIHEVQQVLAEGGLLAGARGFFREKSGWAVAAQVRHQNAMAFVGEYWGNFIVRARSLREAVQQDHGRT